MTRDEDDGSEDYIYRGDQPTSGPAPQDGQPWNPPPAGPAPAAPPPSGPPPITPNPTTPPPGFPPQQPAAVGLPETPKKKRWPWIVAGLVLFCGLPLGGCIGLVAFGVSELSERSEEIESTVEDFFTAIDASDVANAELLADGEAPCTQSSELAQMFESLDTGWTWTAESTAFVERTGNTTLSSNADPETLFINGRPDDSAAVVNGRLVWAAGDVDVEILLSKPLASWRICTVSVR